MEQERAPYSYPGPAVCDTADIISPNLLSCPRRERCPHFTEEIMEQIMEVKMQVSVQCLRLPPESDIMLLFNSTHLLSKCTQNMRHNHRPRKTVLNRTEYLPKWNLIALKNKTKKKLLRFSFISFSLGTEPLPSHSPKVHQLVHGAKG